MADLAPVIRYYEHQLDEKKRYLAELYAEVKKVEDEKKRTLDQIEKEKEAAGHSLEGGQAYLAYVENARAHIAACDETITKMNVRINLAQDDLREAFAELKKFEITQERRDAEEKAALKRKEDQALDEIAIEGYRRKLSEDD